MRKTNIRVSDNFGPVSLSNSEHFIIESQVVGKSYKIFIDKPFDVHTDSMPERGEYPVIYLTDANTSFLMCAEMTRMLQYTKELPPAYLIGIGYPEDDLINFVNRRIQDFTPTADPGFKKICDPSGDLILSDGGDADLFMEFIEFELKPFVSSYFPVSTSEDTLVGDSLGGLFSLVALFSKPALFKRYVIASPAIFWDNGVVWNYEQLFAKENNDLNVKIFMGVGELEDKYPNHIREESRAHMSHLNMVESVGKMSEGLLSRRYQNLELQHHIFESETHISVIAPCLNRGLRSVMRDKLQQLYQ